MTIRSLWRKGWTIISCDDKEGVGNDVSKGTCAYEVGVEVAAEIGGVCETMEGEGNVWIM